MVDLAGLQKFAQVLLAGKVPAQFGDENGADAQAALCEPRLQRGLRGRGAGRAFDQVEQHARIDRRFYRLAGLVVTGGASSACQGTGRPRNSASA